MQLSVADFDDFIYELHNTLELLVSIPKGSCEEEIHNQLKFLKLFNERYLLIIVRYILHLLIDKHKVRFTFYAE